ncbi:MAG: D-glycero-beta-D-manno-heptose 1,7-bisphosphate 7-phosphatase [Campylobacteraceae bacterium]|nr:D-glycero-beta-D-manno-heptose 1,7-bisphosphate 7-phosphatase [Campylobacteraceae bacterium]
MEKINKRKALFLDRDGVINEDFGYVYEISKFEFRDGVFETLKKFQDLDYLLIIITNQSGISRGYYTEEDFHTLTEFMLKAFLDKGIKIDKVYYCPHGADETCECRKPNPGMILKANYEFDIDLENSILVGDKISDIEAGKRAGVKNLFFMEGREVEKSDEFNTVKNIKEILNYTKEI